MIFKDLKIRNASAATKMWKMVFWMAYFFINMIYWNFKDVASIPWGYIFICQNLIFLQSVPLMEQWSKIFDFFMTYINSIAHYKTCQVGRIVPLTSICQKSKKASLQVSQKRDPVSQMWGQLSGIGDQVFWMGDLVFPNGGQIYSCR